MTKREHHLRAKKVKRLGRIVGMLLSIVIFFAVGAVSWLLTCGIIKLIALCFGLTFK